ncbi:hypothetical protein AMECASPLE_028894 [Ameca splendens]|uniref:Uncharacterized protein n=1 Tax=Ameca splendens TaxID=208324 RepID=A0ABV0Y5E3_9TELE
MSLSTSMSSTGVRAPKEIKHQLINSSNCHLCVSLICESFQVELTAFKHLLLLTLKVVERFTTIDVSSNHPEHSLVDLLQFATSLASGWMMPLSAFYTEL